MSSPEDNKASKQTAAVVAQADELQNGQMKRGKVGDTEVVLARANGQYYAFEGNCPHAGAPLDEGALHGTRLICAWHHACFNIQNGSLQEPPALDNIATYNVRQDGENIVVSLPAAEEQQPEAAAPAVENKPTFVILGGGAAGLTAAQKLREEGFGGRLVMITREPHLPYDRTVLSKNYMNGEMKPDEIPLRPEDFYQKHNIETIIQQSVKTVSATGRQITFDNGETLSYDKLLLASGSEPQPVKIPGADLPNVFLLRSWQDCEAILEQADQAKEVVVLGASFIGMEVAASLTKRGLSVAVVAPENVPFAKILGPQIGNVAKGILAEKGVHFYLGDKAASIEGDGQAETVVLESGTRLKADLVVVGLGVKPATKFLEGVPTNDNGSLNVNEYMQVSDNFYAVGDIAQFPSAQSGQPVRVEHWRVAQQHGRIAALAMLDKPQAYDGVPFFWSHPFDYPMNYVGHADKWDDIIYWGEPEDRKFLAFFVQNDKVVAVFDIGYDTELAACEELLRTNKMPSPTVLRAQKPDLLGLLNEGAEV